MQTHRKERNMKIQLLIGICQSDYAEHLSRVLAEKHADVFEVSVCSKPELLGQTLIFQFFHQKPPQTARRGKPFPGDGAWPAVYIPLKNI